MLVSSTLCIVAEFPSRLREAQTKRHRSGCGHVHPRVIHGVEDIRSVVNRYQVFHRPNLPSVIAVPTQRRQLLLRQETSLVQTSITTVTSMRGLTITNKVQRRPYPQSFPGARVLLLLPQDRAQDEVLTLVEFHDRARSQLRSISETHTPHTVRKISHKRDDGSRGCSTLHYRQLMNQRMVLDHLEPLQESEGRWMMGIMCSGLQLRSLSSTLLRRNMKLATHTWCTKLAR